MTPRLSVVIVSYRSRTPLEACLASLEVCRPRLPLEVIVVDNASGDGTVEWIRDRHPWVEVVARADNVGFTRGVNQGFALAKAPHVMMLNPDCTVTVEALQRLLHVLRSDDRISAVAPALLDPDGRVARSCGRFPDLGAMVCDHLGLAQAFPDSPLFGHYKYGGRALETLADVDWASGAALLIARDVWGEVGGLDESIFMYMEEVDWCRRALAHGRVRYVPSARIVHVGQQSSRQVPGETYLHNLRSRVYYFRKHRGRVAALFVKGILCLGLGLKWIATIVPPRTRTTAHVYAAGIFVVWGTSWR